MNLWNEHEADLYQRKWKSGMRIPYNISKKYSCMKKTISIIFFLYLFLAITYAQTTNISGSVVDESGEPIIGATITLKDSRKVGTLTNLEGKFRLSVSAKSKSIIVSLLIQ